MGSGAADEPTVWGKPLPKIVIYYGYCCREWPLALGYPVGKCGLCGKKPKPIENGKRAGPPEGEPTL